MLAAHENQKSKLKIKIKKFLKKLKKYLTI